MVPVKAPRTVFAESEGRSASTIARGVIAPEEPFGEARNRFADSLVPVSARVPEVVIGEPPTVNQGGAVKATLVTVPGPPDPFAAAVINPLALTVMLAFVNEPTLLLTVARVATAPEVVKSPLKFPAAVTSPLPFTVSDAKVPMFELTVAKVVASDPATVVTSPVKAGN